MWQSGMFVNGSQCGKVADPDCVQLMTELLPLFSPVH